MPVHTLVASPPNLPRITIWRGGHEHVIPAGTVSGSVPARPGGYAARHALGTTVLPAPLQRREEFVR